MEFFQAQIIPGEVIVQFFAFLVIFFLLRRFAWKPILNGLDSRRESILQSFEKIDAAKAEIETLKQEYADRLQKIEDEARAKLQEAIEDGRRIAREIQDKAREESQASFEKAKENLALEVSKVRIELRREIAGLTVQAAERLLNEKMSDDEKQNEKILGIIEELEKTL